MVEMGLTKWKQNRFVQNIIAVNHTESFVNYKPEIILSVKLYGYSEEIKVGYKNSSYSR